MNDQAQHDRNVATGSHTQLRALACARWWRLRNRKRFARRAVWRMVIVRIGLVAPVALFLFFSCVLGSAIAFEQSDSATAADNLMVALLIVSFITMVAGCLGVSNQVLFQSREGQFLSSLPLSFRLMLLARVTDFTRGATPGLLFGTAVSLGYLLAEARQTSTLALALPVVAMLFGIAAGFSVIITSIVVRVAPARHTGTALALLGLITLGTVAWIWQSIGRENLFASERSDPSGPSPILEVAPPVWLARTLHHAANGSATAVAYFALGAAAVVFGLLLAARSYEMVYSHAVERTSLGSGNLVPRRSGLLAKTMLRFVPSSVIHWVKREWTLIGRDFGRLSAALWPISAILFFIGSSLFWDRSLLTRESADFWAIHAPVLLLPWGISLGTTIFAIGSEDHEFGLARSLPTSAAAMMIGKYAAYAIPTAFLSCAVGILSLAVAPGNTRDSSLLLGLLFWMAFGCCAIDLAMSAAAPRFGAEPIQRSTPFLTRVLAGVAGLVMAALATIGIAISPVGSRSIGATFGADSLQIGQGGWLFALSIAFLVPITMMVTGTRRAADLLAGD